MPNQGHTRTLFLFFSTDNGIDKSGYLYIKLPGSVGSSFVWTTCDAWELGSTLTAPATFSHKGTKTTTGGSNTFCQFKANLKPMTAYGLKLGIASSAATPSVAAGSYAPIVLQTRYNNDLALAGPVVDSNPAFDSVYVVPTPQTLGLTVSKAAADNIPAKGKPGSEIISIWSLNLAQFSDSTKIMAPYDIVINLRHTNNRAQTG